MSLLFVVLVGRIYFVQVVNADFWYGQAKKTWAATEKLVPIRGKITDRDGNILAMDAAAYTVAVNPEILNKLGLVDQAAAKFHTLLGKSESGLRSLMSAKRENGSYFEQREIRNEGWKIDKDLADRVVAFQNQLKKQTGKKDIGIYLIDEQKRYYPKNSMASQIIGYTDKEGKAVTGLEQYYNADLSGEAGYLKYEKDGKRVQLSNGTVDFKPARDGKNLKLTLDTEIQYYVEAAVKEAYDKYQPTSITAIAADPNTMEILGMVNMPNFNPNKYWETVPGADVNQAIKALYEPGSTFKIVTLAATVQEGIFKPDDTYMSGSYQIGKSRPLRDHKRGGWGEISYLEGLKLSSNVAFIKLGYEKLGAEKLMKYIKDFGFGQKTGIELPGEVAGSVAYKYETEKATMTYGQGRVQVTPIQQVAAVAAVANGGKLMEPHLVKEIEDPMTGKKQVIEPKVVKQVISAAASKKVGEYLEQVVSDQKIGTGKKAYIPGYRIAGKTGTAQTVVKGEKGYSTDKYVVSFIGYAPVDNPKIVVYVVLDQPNDPFAGGGSNAAPVFKKIVEQSLHHMGIMPNTADVKPQLAKKQPALSAPDLTELTLTRAKDELKHLSLDYEIVGKGGKVLQQIPKPGTSITASQRIYLLTEEQSKLAIPNLRGLSLRDALEVCSLLKLRCLTEGEGYVESQILAKQKGEQVLKLVLKPPGGSDADPGAAEADTQ
jgi:penicillin-binding protein 2B